MTEPTSWENFRLRMPVAEKWAYFDHAAVAPLSGPAQKALLEWADDAVANGDAFYSTWNEQIEATRTVSAQMIGASVEEIALVSNTTAGINLVAEGYPWSPGDNVVTLADEFPSNQYPWMHLADRGVETRRVPTDDGRVDLQRVAEACDRQTRILSVSWVGFASGWRNDLELLAKIAHDHGALFFLDAIQGLGVYELDVRRVPVDFLAADGHKWLLGPEGAGIFYLRTEHLETLRPVGVGWNSVVDAHNFNRINLELHPTAERYEGGSRNVPGLIALGASLRLLMEYDPAAIGERILSVTDEACQRLVEIGAKIASDRSRQHASGIVVFTLPRQDPVALRERCLEQGVVLSCRGGRLRLSAHAYNNEEDMDRLVEALR